MKLFGNLKKKVENAQTKEEVRDTIKKAGMLLDDDELEAVSGGFIGNNFANYDSECICKGKSCGPHKWVLIRDLYCCERCHKICEDKKAM